MSHTRSIKSRLLAGVALVVIGGAAFHFVTQSSASPAQTMQAEAPAIPVGVHTLSSQKVQVWSNFSGRLKAVDSAEIRPEVSGRITEVRFADGQLVKKDDVLVVIDPRPYEAAVAKAEAALASAKTNAGFATLEQKRAEDMLKTKAVAQRVYDERANDARVTAAAVKSAEAELKQARLDLEHAYVKAPISGRVSRAELTEGNVVQAGAGAPLLTSIVADSEIYADFEVDEQTYVRNIRALNAAGGAGAETSSVPVKLTLKGDGDHVYEGRIDSFDNQIDPASGTIRARARFSNTDGALIPGMFVQVSMGGSGEAESVTVPEKALGFDQSKKFVFVVTPDNKVEYREVSLGEQVGTDRIVLSGVQAGEKVIIDGIQHVRPGAAVAPTEASADAPADVPAQTASAEAAPVLVEETTAEPPADKLAEAPVAEAPSEEAASEPVPEAQSQEPAANADTPEPAAPINTDQE